MEHHAWVLIERNGETTMGVDDFPPELAKLNCKTFILRLPGLFNGEVSGYAPDLELEVPVGFGLIFKRRTTLTASCDSPYHPRFDQAEKEWKYILSVVPLKQERCEQSSTAHPS
jgi:hypothetical protein